MRRIRLDDGTIAYLQKLVYEMEGLRVLNCQLIRVGNVEGEMYERFLGDYKEACCAYHLAFNEIVREADPGNWDQSHHNVNFSTSELVVSEEKP